MKIIITIALIIIAVPIVLNFIPTKFAKKIDNLKRRRIPMSS